MTRGYVYIYVSRTCIETQADSTLIVRSLDEYIEIRSRRMHIRWELHRCRVASIARNAAYKLNIEKIGLSLTIRLPSPQFSFNWKSSLLNRERKKTVLPPSFLLPRFRPRLSSLLLLPFFHPFFYFPTQFGNLCIGRCVCVSITDIVSRAKREISRF